MKEIQISVIVTVYNKERYICECLNSIKRQVCYLSFEVIIINDGSTDSSDKIIKNICHDDDRFHYFYKKNGGVSFARNYGITKAKGKYLTFIDGDDYIDSHYLTKLYRNVIPSSLLVCGYKEIMGEKILTYKLDTKTINKGNFLNFIFKHPNFKLLCTPYAKLYEHKILKKYNINFDVNTSFGEDTIFVFDYLSHVNKIRVLDYTGYNNRVVMGTLSRKKINNMWQLNKYIIKKADKIFNFKYSPWWNFLYVRAIKLTLLNSSQTYKEFKREVQVIISEKDFKKINLSTLDIKDKILIFCMRQHLIFLVYRLVKFVS